MISPEEKAWLLEGFSVNSSTVAIAVPKEKLRELFDAKAENERLKSLGENLPGYLHQLIRDENDNLNAEIERLNERYRLIEVANKEWTKNDAVTFGKMYEENARLREALTKIATIRCAWQLSQMVAKDALKNKGTKNESEF